MCALQAGNPANLKLSDLAAAQKQQLAQTVANGPYQSTVSLQASQAPSQFDPGLSSNSSNGGGAALHSVQPQSSGFDLSSFLHDLIFPDQVATTPKAPSTPAATPNPYDPNNPAFQAMRQGQLDAINRHFDAGRSSVLAQLAARGMLGSGQEAAATGAYEANRGLALQNADTALATNNYNNSAGWAERQDDRMYGRQWNDRLYNDQQTARDWAGAGNLLGTIGTAAGYFFGGPPGGAIGGAVGNLAGSAFSQNSPASSTNPSLQALQQRSVQSLPPAQPTGLAAVSQSQAFTPKPATSGLASLALSGQDLQNPYPVRGIQALMKTRQAFVPAPYPMQM